MARLPEQPDEFGEEVADLLNSVRPESKAVYVGKFKILIEGSRIDISDLYRMIKKEPDNGRAIALKYFEDLLGFYDSDIDFYNFLEVKHLVMPRIFPQDIADEMEPGKCIFKPWINGCVVAFVLDFPEVTININKQMMSAWGAVYAEDLEIFALKNLWEITKGVPIDMVSIESEDGSGQAKACLIKCDDSYDAARILLPRVYENLRKELGNEYYVAIPSRDFFMAISASGDRTDIIEMVERKVKEDYENMPYPICKRLFLCVKDGIAPGILKPL